MCGCRTVIKNVRAVAGGCSGGGPNPVCSRSLFAIVSIPPGLKLWDMSVFTGKMLMHGLGYFVDCVGFDFEAFLSLKQGQHGGSRTYGSGHRTEAGDRTGTARRRVVVFPVAEDS